MAEKALLVLEDGSFYEGFSFGSHSDRCGEVVFNTSMTGYQEILTDPSYAGQIVIPTYPLIGNYGVNEYDFESCRIQVAGFAVREACREPSHYQLDGTIDEYLASQDIPGIFGLDTRSIVRKIRDLGVMMGMITSGHDPGEALEELKKAQRYDETDFVRQVSTAEPYTWNETPARDASHIVVLDCGTKYSILRIMSSLGARLTVLPCTSTTAEILGLEPDGLILSPGPGNPQLLDGVVKTVSGFVDKLPIMGICLGNQVLARVFGARTYKLKFGHRGGNQPVVELENGHVHITSQNHGYAVDPDGLTGGLEVSHVNINDQTVEGLKHRELPVFSIQYHSEASPGPLDSTYLFKNFLETVDTFRHKK